MNDENRMPSDEELTAFIDGEMSQEEADRIEQLIEADEQVAERLEFLSRSSLPFKEAFAPLMAAAPQEKLQAMLSAIPPQREKSSLGFATRRGMLGGLAASLVAGIFADRAFIGIRRGFGGRDEGSEWRSVVAEYIALYTPDTLAGPVPPADVQAAQLARVDGKLGLALSPEAITLPGVDFKRAQLLQYDDKPLAQLAYLGPDREPLALCIVASDDGAAGPAEERRRGMNVVYWSDASHSFMLIGHAPMPQLETLAGQVRGALAA